MRPRIRIGAVAYLNAEPLVHGLRQGLGGERIELSDAVPAALAQRMRADELDVALLPVIELARLPGLEVVPGLGIVTRGPARSVLLTTRREPQEIDSVALDGESRTSNAMVQVLLDSIWNRRPTFRPGPASLEQALEQHDAAVRIGDKALFDPVPDGCQVFDLGELWTGSCRLPFVYAVWAARPGVVDRELHRMLHESRRQGTRAIDRIAREFRWNGQPAAEIARDYLTHNIQYRLGSAELEAMHRFFQAASGLGLIDAPPEIRLALLRRTACHEAADAARASGVSRL